MPDMTNGTPSFEIAVNKLLTERHLQSLGDRGITQATAHAAGLFSINGETATGILGFPCQSSALAIPYCDPVSGQEVLKRLRLDTPRAVAANKTSKRYLTGKGTLPHLYFPPHAAEWLTDTTALLYVVEGEFKALRLSQDGLNAVSVPGVYGWRSRATPTGTTPDLDLIVWKGREVVLGFDNDLLSNPQVEKALAALAEELYRRGARLVSVLEIPLDEEHVKFGVDDYLQTFGTDAFLALPRHEVENTCEPLQVFDLHAFLSLDIQPRGYVLSPIIPTQGLVMLHAQRGTGKTFVSLGIAYAVSSGGQFLRWHAEKPRKILFVDGEMPAAALQERLEKLAAENETTPPSPDYFKILAADQQTFGIPGLASVEGQALVEQHLDGVDLLILDNLSTLASYGEENAAESWQPLQAWALKLRRQGVSVLFVHHSGKSGMQRGTSKREDVLDTVINLKQPSDYEPEQGARFEVHLEKSRGLVGDGVSPFEAQLSEDEHGRQTWTVKDLKAAERERVVVLTQEGLTQRQIAQELNLSLGKVNKLMRLAKMQGEL